MSAPAASFATAPAVPSPLQRRLWDALFLVGMAVPAGLYVLLIVSMLAAMATFTTPWVLWSKLGSAEIRYAIQLSLVSCTLSTIFSLWVAVPAGYVLSRVKMPSALKHSVDAIIDIPVVLPPLVIGLGLLILFQTPLGRWFEQNVMPVSFAIPSVILAQFTVACAFAVRTMRITFEQIDPRCEQVAQTLGCSRNQAFWLVVLPEARRGMLSAGTLAWARSLGEFGPILIFSGATRMRTEVLSTSVFLEMSVGDIKAAVAVSIIMILAALAVLVLARVFGLRRPMV